MARKPRVEYEGAFYHVMARGDRDQDIYGDDEDRRLFVELMGQVCGRTGWRIHSWVLMGNHFHWLLETPEANLVTGMKWFMGAYTQKFNRRHQFYGHLFQGRYKAIPIQEGDYLLRVSDYIHLNPVRAGAIQPGSLRLEDYSWSSYGVWIKRGKIPHWSPMNSVLNWCGLRKTQVKEYRQRLKRLVKESLKGEMDWGDLKKGWMLGDEGFAQEMVEQVGKWMGKGGKRESYVGKEVCRHDEVQAREWLKVGLERLGIEPEDLSKMAKTDVRKRALAAWLKSKSIVSNGWLAEALNMGYSGNAGKDLKHKNVADILKTLKSKD